MECSRRSPCVHEEREHRCLHEIRSSACAHATHLESDGLNSIQYYFSSRRRHTRSDRDWSSDVCSSDRSEEHTSELQSRSDLVCRLLLVTGVQTCALPIDRKSTRLNSSHDQISYAVFCLKKKKTDRESRQQDSRARVPAGENQRRAAAALLSGPLRRNRERLVRLGSECVSQRALALRSL